MILFCGIPSEPPIALAIEAADAIDAEYVVFNQRHAPYCDAMLDVRDGRISGSLWMWEQEFPFSVFSGVYTRLIDSTELPEVRSLRAFGDGARTEERSAFLHEILNEWFEVADCLVVNRTSAMASNGSKPYQAQIIADAGFAIPDTIVTNEPDEVRAFARSHGRVVYKSTSAIRSIVQELPRDVPPQVLDRIRTLPTQFQQFIDGTNVRVHVIGDRVFATEITSNAVDYRYGHREGLDAVLSTISVPDHVADRCVDLASRLTLPFCGIDLKRTNDGRFYCFEVNPSPAYSYYQEETGQPIAAALIEYLVSSANRLRGDDAQCR
jgi:glutathione synthase/RimK-type ligase-like ATP-grasp enzyme